MADKIDAGAILIEEGGLLPESLRLESERCLNGWRRVKNLDGSELRPATQAAGANSLNRLGQKGASDVRFPYRIERL